MLPLRILPWTKDDFTIDECEWDHELSFGNSQNLDLSSGYCTPPPRCLTINSNNIHNNNNIIHNHTHTPNYHSNNYLSNHNPSYSSSSSSHQRYIRPTEPDGPINEYGVYCGNLAWDVTSDMLKEFLSQIGTVVSCELFLNYDGRSKGSALAKFETKESATRAILELNDTDFKGRLIQVRPDREKPKRDDDRPPVSMPLSERQIPPGVDSRRVYVGNLGWGVAWQDLKDHMRQAGDVIRAEIMQGPGGRSKGCGIVEYSSADEARHAIAVLHDTELQGRLILVRQDKDDGRHSVPHLPHYSSMLSPLSPYMGNLGSPTHPHPHSHSHPHSHQHQHHPLPPHPHSPYSERWNHHHHQPPPPPPPPPYMMNHQPPYMMNHQQQSLYSTPSGVPIPPLSSPRLYIGNLVYEVSWQELKDHMRVAGEVVRIDLKMSPDGRNKGCGIIEYRDIQSAQRALAMLSDSLLRGRPIFLREDREERKMMTDRRM